jgi:hypothetical protein
MTWDNFSRDAIQWRLKLAQGEPAGHVLARLTAAILAEPPRPPKPVRPMTTRMMGFVAVPPRMAPPEPPLDLISCTCRVYPCLWFTPPDDLPW